MRRDKWPTGSEADMERRDPPPVPVGGPAVFFVPAGVMHADCPMCSPVAELESFFRCPECGDGAAVDEDRCCVACGLDCTVVDVRPAP